jgi:hypothetical protein
MRPLTDAEIISLCNETITERRGSETPISTSKGAISALNNSSKGVARLNCAYYWRTRTRTRKHAFRQHMREKSDRSNLCRAEMPPYLKSPRIMFDRRGQSSSGFRRLIIFMSMSFPPRTNSHYYNPRWVEKPLQKAQKLHNRSSHRGALSIVYVRPCLRWWHLVDRYAIHSGWYQLRVSQEAARQGSLR